MFLNLAHASFVKIKTIKPLELFDNHPQGICPENHEPLFHIYLRTTKSSQMASLPQEVIFGFILMRFIFGELRATVV